MYEDRVVVVTGASRGLGRQVCEHFLSHGARVIGLSRSAGQNFENDRYCHFAGDVSDEDFVKETFRLVKDRYESVHILINNAGVLLSQLALLTSDSSAEGVIRTNFLGAVGVTRECAKVMLRNKFGRIVNISSMAVPLSPIGSAIYSASKSALTQFSRVFAKEVADSGITCNVLGITAFDSEMTQSLSQNKLEELIQSLAIKRSATIGDITNVIDFFVREESSNVTGQVVYLGGA